MLSFMVLAAPRSGTTWVANWLTTDTSLCLHDPLFQRHYSQFDSIPSSKTLGISCTGTANFLAYVNSHPARKVILHRAEREVSASLAAIGLEPPNPLLFENLEKISGMHVYWRDVFDNPKPIYEWLLDKAFDPERHAVLKEMAIQPYFRGIEVGPEVTRRLLDELRGLYVGLS